jgi:hypothetical protein
MRRECERIAEVPLLLSVRILAVAAGFRAASPAGTRLGRGQPTCVTTICGVACSQSFETTRISECELEIPCQ